MLLSILRAIAVTTCLAASAAVAVPQLVLVNGKVYTADPARPYVDALAIEDGRIRAAGTDAEVRALIAPSTRVVDVRGRLVTPGLIEAHVHLGWMLPSPPLLLPGLPFPGPSSEQVLGAVAVAAKDRQTRPGWISAWIGPATARDRRNWRDAVAPDRPVLLRGFWGHTTIVNSVALERLGVTEAVENPVGGWWGRDANGRLNGRAYEAAEMVEQRVRRAEPAELARVFAEAARQYARWGVTSIHLMNSGSAL
jgi:predicted amidohydrolase YtcJ